MPALRPGCRDVDHANLFLVEARQGGGLYDYETDCARYLDDHWDAITKQRPVDVILSGGWPFFHVATLAARHGVPSMFIDAGSVPQDGLGEGPLGVQRAVRRLRSMYLPHFDRVLPISHFIAETQTVPDRGSRDGVQVIHLGVDHLAGEVFADAPDESEGLLVARLGRLATRGTKLVLALGRYEATGYKNSGASFTLLRELLRRSRDAGKPDFRLLILAKADDLDVPEDIEGHVICLDSPGDASLIEIMKLASVGFSPSLWEGFNLPVGEMQILGKAVFAFNVGAHPEVILHPWFLCATIGEAAEKICRTVTDGAPGDLLDSLALADYREKFTWKRTLADYRAALAETIAAGPRRATPKRLLLIDVSNASRDTANSGVIRVTRRLSAELQRRSDIRVFFVFWDQARRDYSFVTGLREDLLAGYNGPAKGFGALLDAHGADLTPRAMLDRFTDAGSVEAMLLISEVVLDGEAAARIDWADRRGVKSAAILYDLIPMEFPHYVGAELRTQFALYLDTLPRVEQIISISAYSLERFRAYMERRARSVEARADVVWIPGQFAALPRAAGVRREQRQAGVLILCVSTIEPRKNHRTLLAAYRRFRAANPDLAVRLCLVGNYYHEAEQLADEIRRAVAEDASIEWRVAISDEELTGLMRAATFTVYPSLVEGFGLPILESLWMAKPCLCHEQGVMAELAAGGGCLTVDMDDADALAAAIKSLVTNHALRDRLAEEAQSRPIANWSDYARTVAALLFPGAATTGVAESAGQGAARLAPNAAFEALVKRNSGLLRHRLSGIGALVAPPPAPEPSSTPSHPPSPPAEVTAPVVVPAAAVVERRGFRDGFLARSWLARLTGYGKVSARQVERSGLFDAGWYLARYPDVRESGLDPLQHFAEWGHRETRSPGPDFDAARYLAENPGIAGSGLSAFAHYLRYRESMKRRKGS